MKRKKENSEHMSRLKYLDHFIEENYAQMKNRKIDWMIRYKIKYVFLMSNPQAK